MLDEHGLDAFEHAWLTGQNPVLREAIDALAKTSAAPLPRSLLEEFVMIDMEGRWRLYQDTTDTSSSNPTSLETYQRDFPELGTTSELSVQLIAEEYHARQRWGDHPSVSEYQERFPSQWPELREALDAMAHDVIQATVSVWQQHNLLYEMRLPSWLEIGRQSTGEPEPCQDFNIKTGRRLIIAPITARHLSRQHVTCEPSGKSHVQITCVSRKNPVFVNNSKLRAGESQRAALPIVLDFGDWRVRLVNT